MIRTAVLIVVLGTLAGCTTIGLTSSFCDLRSGIKPIRLTASERAALAPEPKRDILAVNNFGFANCNWKP